MVLIPFFVLRKSLPFQASNRLELFTVADGKSSPCLGSLRQVSVSFGGLVSKMDFLVVTGTPYDVIVGMPSLEELLSK